MVSGRAGWLYSVRWVSKPPRLVDRRQAAFNVVRWQPVIAPILYGTHNHRMSEKNRIYVAISTSGALLMLGPVEPICTEEDLASQPIFTTAKKTIMWGRRRW